MTSFPDAQADVDREPTRRREGLFLQGDDPAGPREEIPFVRQGRRQRHGAAMAPEGRIIPLRGGVMQNEKVAQPLVFEGREAIVFGADRRLEVAVGEQREQAPEAGLNEMTAGPLERLEEPRRLPEGETVPHPRARAAPGFEALQPRPA